MRRTMVVVIPIAVVALAGSTGCATKSYVGKNMTEMSDQINGRIDGVSKSLEETQEQTRQNSQQIKQVDQRAAAAAETANAADRAAAAAQGDADRAMTRAEAVDKATRKLVYEVVLSEAQGDFGFDKAELSDAMKAKLDELIEKLKADPQGGYIEIEGYTDSTGAEAYNKKLGLERAQAVQQYLHQQHNIPLQKISVVSFGEQNPVAPNDTREGRAQNRRVVIKVLA